MLFLYYAADMLLIIVLMGLATVVFDNIIICTLLCAAALCLVTKYIDIYDRWLQHINYKNAILYIKGSWEHVLFVVVVIELYYNISGNFNVRAMVCVFILMRELVHWIERENHKEIIQKFSEASEHMHTPEEMARATRNFNDLKETYADSVRQIKKFRQMVFDYETRIQTLIKDKATSGDSMV